MAQRLLAVATIGTVAWSLWVRRHTWYNNQFQIGATAMVALGGGALILMTPPATATVGMALHHIVGRYGLNLYVAHMLGIGACAAALYNAVVAFYTDETLARKWMQHVVFPSRIMVAVLLPLFWASRDTHQYRSSLIDMHVDGWMRLYWIVLCSFYIYLLGYASRAFLAMRHHQGCRTVARIYLAAALSGIAACVDRIVLAIDPALGFAGRPLIVFPGLTCMFSFAIGAGYAWRQHRRRYSSPPPEPMISGNRKGQDDE